MSYEDFGGLIGVFPIPQGLEMTDPFKPSGLPYTKRLYAKIEQLLGNRQAGRPFRKTGSCKEGNHGSTAALIMQRTASGAPRLGTGFLSS
jgi:hypothetical protein